MGSTSACHTRAANDGGKWRAVWRGAEVALRDTREAAREEIRGRKLLVELESLGPVAVGRLDDLVLGMKYNEGIAAQVAYLGRDVVRRELPILRWAASEKKKRQG